MSERGEKLQDAIGLVKDEYILEAHGETAEASADAAQNQSAGNNGNAPKPNEGTVIEMKPQAKRKRSLVVPLAAAACLVLAMGVGAFALLSAPSPTADMEATEESESALKAEVEDGSHAIRDGEYASSAAKTDAMTSESVADGAAGAEAREPSTSITPSLPPDDWNRPVGEAFVLTAAEWNDNDNWPFFMNLVNSGTISFPAFGIDPRNRVKATIVDGKGNAVRGQEVTLVDIDGNELWHAVSGKDGAAYLFYREGEIPSAVSAGDVKVEVSMPIEIVEDQQGKRTAEPISDVTIEVAGGGSDASDLQVMFIVDTTGSMSDEIAYLQKDFAAIAEDVGSDGITYSANFYRDEGDDYVTKLNSFTDSVETVQKQLNAEYADGGGDTPEAVAQILTEAITDNGEWRDDCNKVAFLIFDAPPHDGTDAELDAAVRSAAERGIRLVPVVASNAERDTELFARALAICTDGTYVFLTDDSGVGDSHLEPIVGDYTVESLHDVIVRIIEESR